jgi:hypothetical protein
MGRVNLRLAERMIEAGQPVVSLTGSLTADWQFDDDSYSYVVRSYGVDVAKVERKQIKDSEGNLVRTAEGKPKYDLTLWVTPTRYSVTTSRHTNLAKRALQIQLTREAENG